MSLKNEWCYVYSELDQAVFELQKYIISVEESLSNSKFVELNFKEC